MLHFSPFPANRLPKLPSYKGRNPKATIGFHALAGLAPLAARDFCLNEYLSVATPDDNDPQG
jgi:hypothetical protein